AAFLGLLAFARAVASAKGIFQAQGLITDPARVGDTITFRFAGRITSGYATAPDSARRRRWVTLELKPVDVPVAISEWTVRHDPGRRDERPDIDAVLAE